MGRAHISFAAEPSSLPREARAALGRWPFRWQMPPTPALSLTDLPAASITAGLLAEGGAVDQATVNIVRVCWITGGTNMYNPSEFPDAFTRASLLATAVVGICCTHTHTHF